MYPIPANATRIRYLESTGTQYVDTGIAPGNNAVEWEFSFEYTKPSSGADGIFGSRQTTTAYRPDVYNVFAQAAGLRLDCTSRSAVYSNPTNPVLLEFDSSNTTVNGTNYYNGTKAACDYSLCIFAINTAGTVTASGSRGKGKIYYCKIWKSGVLAFDGIPVRVGSGSSAVGYLCDRVSGTLFGNAADNDAGFPAECLGPDTFQHGVVPTRMMAMGVRRRVRAARFLKFYIASQRSSDVVLQFSEVRLIDANDTPFVWPTGTTAKAIIQGIDTSSTVLSGEEPIKALDGSVDTKYCSGNVSQKYGLRSASPTDFVIDLGASGSVDLSRYSRWQWFTANDSPNRDPSSFSLSSSGDGVNWTLLDSATITPTTSRKTLAYTGTLK